MSGIQVAKKIKKWKQINRKIFPKTYLVSGDSHDLEDGLFDG